jgi:hypothetical protein
LTAWTPSHPLSLQVIQGWEPPVVPHCSNCRHASVSGSPDEPTVSCAMAHGTREISLWRLIRPLRPLGFRAAINCPDFASMDEP